MLFVPVQHPAVTFSRPTDLGPLTAHVNNFVRRALLPQAPAPLLTINPPAESLERAVAECLRLDVPLAVDVETGKYGLLPKFARLTAIGVGYATETSATGLSWSWPLPPDVKAVLAAALANPRLRKLGMNARFYDWPILRRYGFVLGGRLEDIKQLRRALSSTSLLGLGPQASYYCLATAWKTEGAVEESLVAGGQSSKARAKLLRYNAEDCARTAQVERGQRADLARDPADRARVLRIYEQNMRLAELSSEMSYKGFPVDKKAKALIFKQLGDVARREAALLRKLVAPRVRASGVFRIGKTGANPTDLRALLFAAYAKAGIDSFNLDVPMHEACRTDQGLASTDKDALLVLYAEPTTPPEAKAIIKAHWRAAAPHKAAGTFIDSEMIRNAIGPDGRLHASINSDGTETGRWSCSSPNLFNLSEKQEEGKGLRGDLPSVRHMYAAPDGFVIVHRDMEQFEVHVMAQYTGDAPLQAALKSGDVHTARARAWFNIPDDQPVPAQARKAAKIGGLAFQYCASVGASHLQWLRQDQEAQWSTVATLHALFPQRHPGIAAHWQRSVDFALEHGYSEAPIMNWRRHYPPDAPIKPTETSNYAIQGGAAAIMNSVFVGTDPHTAKKGLYYLLRRYFPQAWVAMHTYDSIDVIAPIAQAEAIARMMDEAMSGPWDVGGGPYLYPSSCKIAKSWGDV